SSPRAETEVWLMGGADPMESSSGESILAPASFAFCTSCMQVPSVAVLSRFDTVEPALRGASNEGQVLWSARILLAADQEQHVRQSAVLIITTDSRGPVSILDDSRTDLAF